MERLTNDLIRIQLAVVDGWITLLAHMWRGSQHLWLSNLALMRHPAFHRWHYLRPDGADWMDHYGRRHQDVDVEHMR